MKWASCLFCTALAACAQVEAIGDAPDAGPPPPPPPTAATPLPPRDEADASPPSDPHVLARPRATGCDPARVLWFFDEPCIACIGRTCCPAARACAFDVACRMLPRCVDGCRASQTVDACVHSCSETAGAEATSEYVAVYDDCAQTHCADYCPSLY